MQPLKNLFKQYSHFILGGLFLLYFIFHICGLNIFPLEDTYYYLLEIKYYSQSYWQGFYTNFNPHFIFWGLIHKLIGIDLESFALWYPKFLFFFLYAIPFVIWLRQKWQTHLLWITFLLTQTAVMTTFQHWEFILAFCILLIGMRLHHKWVKIFFMGIASFLHPVCFFYALLSFIIKYQLSFKVKSGIAFLGGIGLLILALTRLKIGFEFIPVWQILYFKDSLELTDLIFYFSTLIFANFFLFKEKELSTRLFGGFVIVLLLPIFGVYSYRMTSLIGFSLLIFTFLRIVDIVAYSKIIISSFILVFISFFMAKPREYQLFEPQKVLASFENIDFSSRPIITHKGYDFFLNFKLSRDNFRTSFMGEGSEYDLLIRDQSNQVSCELPTCRKLGNGWKYYHFFNKVSNKALEVKIKTLL